LEKEFDEEVAAAAVLIRPLRIVVPKFFTGARGSKKFNQRALDRGDGKTFTFLSAFIAYHFDWLQISASESG
jgi:hypothetical protein